MRLQLFELQNNNKEAKVFKASFPEDWKDDEGVFQYQGLLYIPKLICSKVIRCHHDNLLVRHFRIDKTQKLIGQNYYWPSLKKNVELYVKECNICLTSKAVKHKLYDDLQSLLIPTYYWKNFLIDFKTGLVFSANWKSNSYNLIFIIIDPLTKMIYYKLVKVTIDV